MKTDNKIALVGAAIGAGLLWLINKNKSTNGIGTLKYHKFFVKDINNLSELYSDLFYVLENTGYSIKREYQENNLYLYLERDGLNVKELPFDMSIWQKVYSTVFNFVKDWNTDAREFGLKADLSYTSYGLLVISFWEKNDAIHGIGATKRKPRRIWAEVSDAQDAGIDLTNPNGWESSKGKLDKLMAYHNAHINSKSDKPSHQLYFNQLRRAYKSIAGTNLPCENYTVRNENGDVILIYNDYNLQELPQKAAGWVYDQACQNTDAEFAGYWITIAQIAQGKKFVWPGKGVHRGICQLVFGVNQPSERKLRISYLASPEKGGVYPEPFAEHEWSDGLADRWDAQDFMNGVLMAFKECNSVGQAQQMCADEYINAHQLEEPALFQDVPF